MPRQKEFIISKKKIFPKKRKFRLRDLFRWKKKIKKAKQEENIKTSPSAGWSLALAIVGSAIMLLGGINSGFLTVTFLLLEVIAFILGIIGLRSIKKYPKRFKGKEVAWAGIIISSLWMLIVLAFFYWLLFIYGN